MELPDGQDLQQFVKSLGPEGIRELRGMLGIKARAPKEASPEYIAAKQAYDQIVAENPDFVKRLEAAREGMRTTKGARVVNTTTTYKLDKQTGDITMDGEKVTNFMEEGWQGTLRQKGLTQGQVAAISKEKKKLTNPKAQPAGATA